MNCANHSLLLLAFLSLILAASAAAVPRENLFSTRSFDNEAVRRSPVVHADNRVSFLFHAPGAREVTAIVGEWDNQKLPLTKDSDGWWSGTLGPVATGLHTYVFSVDGTPVIDPLNPHLKVGTVVYGSVVEVSGNPPRFDALQEVPQGALHKLRFRSSAQNRFQTLHVHLPAAYALQSDRVFPVLYLRHGGGDDDRSWMQDGRAGEILENLLAAGKAEPMIIVTTNGMTDGTWSHASSAEGMSLLEEELMQDVIPLIERSYRVSKNRNHRALAGLSMGGGQAFVIGLRQLESFSWIAQFSSGLLADRELKLIELSPALRNAEKVNAALHLLWLGCGQSDSRYNGHLNLLDELHSLGVRAEFHPSEGGHEWSVWRDQLHRLLPVLFREEKG